MKTIKRDCFFQDEAPRIGCGMRRCSIKLGRKWARVRELATGRTSRIPVSVVPRIVRGRPI